MSVCSLIQCRSRKTPKTSHLTFHRLPEKKELRQKWLDIIGVKNLKQGMKSPRICSLHFEEASFNRTLNLTRLRDDALPSRHLIPSKAEGWNWSKIKNVGEQAPSMTYRAPIIKEVDPLRLENDSDATASDLDLPNSSKSSDDTDATDSDSDMPSPSKPLSSKTHTPVRSKMKSIELQASSTKNQAPTIRDLNPICIVPSNKALMPGQSKMKSIGVQASSMKSQAPTLKRLNPVHIESFNKNFVPVQSKMKSIAVQATSMKNQAPTMKEQHTIPIEDDSDATVSDVEILSPFRPSSSKVIHAPVRVQASSKENQAPKMKEQDSICIADDSDASVSDSEMPSPPKSLSSKKTHKPRIKIRSVIPLVPSLKTQGVPMLELSPTRAENNSDTDSEMPSPSKPLSSENANTSVRNIIQRVVASSTKNQAPTMKELNPKHIESSSKIHLPIQSKSIAVQATSMKNQAPTMKEQHTVLIQNDSDVSMSDVEMPSTSGVLDDSEAMVADKEMPSSSKPYLFQNQFKSTNEVEMPSSTVKWNSQFQMQYKMIRMQKTCVEHRRKIKCLNQKILRQSHKITRLHNVINDLKKQLKDNKEDKKIVIVVV